MSETYRTVVTNGKTNKQTEQTGTISKHRKKNLAPSYAHTEFGDLEFVFVVHFFLAGMRRALVPRRVGESEARRGPGASRERCALVVDHQSPRERGESRASRCIILYKSASLFPARASCRSGLRRFGETPARAHNPSLSLLSQTQLIIRRI
jgi:hypothetical protein